MKIAAATCRAQEAIQRDLSINAPLENRRKIAAKAAIFWANEASLAELRESGHKEQATDLDKDITAEFAREAEAEADGDRNQSGE